MAYGSLCIFLDEKESKTCIPEAGYGYHKDHTESKGEKEFPCTGISYLSNVKYSSDNKKVAKVNSSGEIQAKKPVQLISGVKLNSMAILTISSAR